MSLFFTDPRLRDTSGLPPAVRPEAGSLPHICCSVSVRTEALVVHTQTLKRFNYNRTAAEALCPVLLHAAL